MAKLNWDRPYRGMDESGSQLDRFVIKDQLADTRRGKSRREEPRKEERTGATFFLSPASGLVHVGAFGRTLCGFSILSTWTGVSKSRATCLKCKRLSTPAKAEASSRGAQRVEKKLKNRPSESSKTKSYLTLSVAASLRVSRVLERAKDRRQFFITSIQGDIYVMTPTKRSKLLGELATRVTSEKLRRDYQLPVKTRD